MSIQIAVRLPEHIVVFIDGMIARGQGGSRAEIVVDALEFHRRRLEAEQDARIYAESVEPADLDDLATWAAGRSIAVD